MVRIKDIYDNLCALAPVETQMSFDNAGFLVGHEDAEVKKVLLALDITDEVIDEAQQMGAQLIVSHHPLFLQPLRAVTDCSAGRKALILAESRIAAICMHTNLDIAQGGVNDVLIRLLGAEPQCALEENGLGRVGELKDEMPFETFLIMCRNRLKVQALRYCSAGRAVKRIAVLGGGGADFIETAVKMGCDTFITSDIKYHKFQLAQELGLNIIDGDHFCTENPVIPVMAERLRKAFPQLEFTVSKKHAALIRFI